MVAAVVVVLECVVVVVVVECVVVVVVSACAIMKVNTRLLCGVKLNMKLLTWAACFGG